MEKYFIEIENEVKKAYDIANRSRAKQFDPENKVDIPVAKNIFERVEGLVGAEVPGIFGSGISKRLEELDKKYGAGDWRVALTISEEVAKEKFCKFENQVKAIEAGIRVGLAYLTMGVVSAPLEGFIEFRIKDRNDGGNYAAAYFAGPVRAAGGTASAVCLILADYLRKIFDIGEFDPTKEEIERIILECGDYHERVARLQYFPDNKELQFLLKQIPVEINGIPTSQREVLIHKDLPRIGTPKIRGGMCLVLCEGLAQKANKILKTIKKWDKDFNLENWEFLKEYTEIKTTIHAGGSKKEDDVKIKPNVKFIEETVAGRPIFAYPLKKGGFRIRYGRSRVSGLAATAIHPATTRILGDFPATGAQLRLERPGKACIVTPATSIDGPVIKLLDESVIKIKTEEQAIKHKNNIKEILFLGDMLIPYGEFVRNNHKLVPSPYVEEWWIQDLIKATRKMPEGLETLNPEGFIKLSLEHNIPLHPEYLFFYNDINPKDLILLIEALSRADIEKTIDSYQITLKHDKFLKKILEDIYIPHHLTDKGIVIEKGDSLGLLYALGYLPEHSWDLETPKKLEKEGKTTLEILNKVSKIRIMDKTGIYLGARLGRPEKAKQRKLKGSPQTLFPVGTQGGRLRSLNESLKKGFVEADYPSLTCPKCKTYEIYMKCRKCKTKTEEVKVCFKCSKETDKDKHCGMKTVSHKRKKLDIRPILDEALTKLKVTLPQVKGVRGTSNKLRLPEPLEKGILRAIHNVYVNKDGTIRYDAIEAPITHFKPKEIGTPIEKLKELGYEQDINRKPLTNEDQILELLPQDVILPDCREWQDASAMTAVHKICSFVDDLLVKYYDEKPYYTIKSPRDMIGQLIIGLAPHTSAGIIGRIVGFSKTQCFFAHPYFHSACRRNCDGDELCFMMLMDALLNFSRQYLPDRIGGRAMDAPLVLTTRLDPEEVDDEVYNMDIVGMYPLEFYEMTLKWKSPYSVNIKQIKDTLGTPEQYKGILFTHPTEDINAGNRISAYKTLTSVFDKVKMQMKLAEKIRAVNKSDVAQIVIEKHFLKDIKGNLRKFSKQEFRCVECNQKYRRIPLTGRCKKCTGKLVLTVSEGTVSKYLEPSLGLADKYTLPDYLKQTLDILKRGVDSVFGKEPTKQVGLKDFIK